VEEGQGTPLTCLPLPPDLLCVVGAMRTRVLIIEDDPDNRESLALLLEAWGYQVFVAETGERGIALAIAEQPHIMLLDLGLPGIQGTGVATIVKAMPKPPFIVAYTGFDRLEDAAMAGGCDAFIVKPGLDELAELLVSIGLEQLTRKTE
jgi:CheY-like chemotaxis protein